MHLHSELYAYMIIYSLWISSLADDIIKNNQKNINYIKCHDLKTLYLINACKTKLNSFSPVKGYSDLFRNSTFITRGHNVVASWKTWVCVVSDDKLNIYYTNTHIHIVHIYCTFTLMHTHT